MHRIQQTSSIARAAATALISLFSISLSLGCGGDEPALQPDAGTGPADAAMQPADAATQPADAAAQPADAATQPDSAPQSMPPTIGTLTDVATPEDTLLDLALTVADPDTALDALDITVTSSDTAVVANTGLVLDGSGESRSLRIQPEADASGTTTITVEVADAQDTARASFELTVTPVNDAPVAVADSFLNTAGARGNVRFTAPASVLANDTDVDGPTLAVTPFAGTQNSAQGGDVTLLADGTFVYTPAPGFVGTDSFTYEVEDNAPDTSLTATGTVTIEVSGPVIWFVDNQAASAGDGRDVSPFAALASVEAAPVTGTGDIIQVARGDGTTTGYDQGIVLGDDQTLRAAVAAEPPVITSAAGDAITLANGNTVANVRIAAPAGAGIAADGSSGAFVISSVSITDAVGHGVLLQNSGTASFRFDGLAITTNGGRGFVASDAGTVTITQSAIDSTGNTAVDISATTLDVTLRRVSASNAPSGMVLSNTGGSFVVTGDGSNARNGSGGVLRNLAGHGVSLSSATGVSLASVTIDSTGDDGILGTDVTDFTLRGGNLTGNGDAAGEHGIEVRNLLGNAVIANTAITASKVDALRVFNDSGTLSSLRLENNRFTDNDGSLGNAGVNLETRATARMEDVTITGSTFSGLAATGLIASANDTSFLRVSATGSTFTNNNIALSLTTGQAGSLAFDISDNPTITGHQSHAINLFTASASTGGTLTGTIANNAIGAAGTAGSGSAIGNGIRININGQASATVAARNNTIREIAQGRGIEARARLGTGGLELTLEGNDVVTDPSLGLAAIFVSSNTSNPICANVRDNAAAGGPFFAGPFGGAYIIGEGDDTPGILQLEGFITDLETTLQNNGNTGTPMSQLGTITAPGAPCATP